MERKIDLSGCDDDDGSSCKKENKKASCIKFGMPRTKTMVKTQTQDL